MRPAVVPPSPARTRMHRATPLRALSSRPAKRRSQGGKDSRRNVQRYLRCGPLHQLISRSDADLDVVECVERTTQTNVRKHERFGQVASSRHVFDELTVGHHKMRACNSALAERTRDRHQRRIGHRAFHERATAHDSERKPHDLATLRAAQSGVRHTAAGRTGGISDSYSRTSSLRVRIALPSPPFYANICSRSRQFGPAESGFRRGPRCDRSDPGSRIASRLGAPTATLAGSGTLPTRANASANAWGVDETSSPAEPRTSRFWGASAAITVAPAASASACTMPWVSVVLAITNASALA